jgi:thioesterase DpgC
MTAPTDVSTTLEALGLPIDDVRVWANARPILPPAGVAEPGGLARDTRSAARYYELGTALLGRLPARPRRNDLERAAADVVVAALRDTRTRFLRAYADLIYADLTGDYQRFLRADELVYRAAERYPGLTPTRADVAAEQDLPLKDKAGVEIDQGIFLSQILARPRAGAHLVHAMLRPKPDSVEKLPEFQSSESLDLGTVVVERRGPSGYVYLRNPRYLNAEDDATIDALETATDLVLLDPRIQVGVLRGGTVEHPKYPGRHVFCAGLNLTHLYQGKISFLFYINADMGLLNKFYRGLTGPEFWPGEPEANQEKPWIAAVEAFAIGGGCQILLVMDHVLAESGSYFNLPARKEGIIPGCANLRLTRVVGERLARQGILFDRQFPADSPEGRLLCDEVVPAGEMAEAIDRVVDSLASSGMVSAAANRKALRLGQEPLAQFQAYMATYAREQAYCHFSPALIRNLETYWTSRQRAKPSGDNRSG